MPLLVELPEAGNKLRTKFNNDLPYEHIFRKPESLGDFVSNGFAANDQFPSTLDGDPVIKTFNNFTINAGHTVIPINRCKGMYLFIEGDLIVNGLLSMTARGANAPGKFIGIDYRNSIIYYAISNIFTTYPNISTISPEGGSGGTSSTTVSNHGGVGINGACGGGGAGQHRPTNRAARGGYGRAGTSFSGGPGGGGASDNAGKEAIVNGGAGGAGGFGNYINAGCGGAGNPAGAGGGSSYYTRGNPGANGTGGLIILIVKGSVLFGPSGQIISAGSNGGSKSGCTSGGGSGGGAIHLFHKGDISNPEKITAPGGTGGRSGGNGSIHLNKI